MGTCLSNEKLPENVFHVRNIHDDNTRYPKGIIEVTAVELIYTDAKSRDRWVWPLKYLRKYGCDGDIFSFEAGRKCPGGEGLYAFSTKKAALLFEMVARNINIGGLSPESEAALSPQNNTQHAHSHSPLSPVPPQLLPPPVPSSNPPPLPPTTIAQYQNLQYVNGQRVLEHQNSEQSPPPFPSLSNHVPHSSSTPSPPTSATAAPPKFQYQEVAFLNPPGSHPPPPSSENSEEKRVSYTQIDIQQTEEYNRRLQEQAASNARPLPELTGSTFIDPSTLSTHGKNSHIRLPAASVSSHRSLSDSSVGSPSSPHTSLKDISLAANGDIPKRGLTTSVSAIETSTYQNLTLSAHGPQMHPTQPHASLNHPQVHQQHNYMNLEISRTSLPHVASLGRKPSDHPSTYENLTLGVNSTSPPSHSTPNPSLYTGHPRVTGGSTSMYADLDLPRRTSTPRSQSLDHGDMSASRQNSHTHSTYPVLEFHTPTNGVATNTTPVPQESSFAGSSGGGSPKHTDINITASLGGRKDEGAKNNDRVTYGVLDFKKMEVLKKVCEERELDMQEKTEEFRKHEEEKKRKEEEKAEKTLKKKEKKKKDRRSSHN